MPVGPLFGESSVGSIGNPSDNPTKDPIPVPIIKPSSGPSETLKKYPSHVSN